jgi:hypothetical protein
MALERELATYQRELPMLLAQEGRFAVIAGDEVLGMYDTYHDALQAGYEKRGFEPFLVKRISAVEEVHWFSRDIRPCHT